MEYENRYLNSQIHDVFWRIYGWMAFALVITGLVAYVGAFISPFNQFIRSHLATVLIVSVVAQLAIVIAISFFINKLSFFWGAALFLAFSFFMGVTFTSIFQVYTFSSIITTFFVACGMFALMAIYGAYTDVDLSNLGSILQMGLIGLIIALFINIFWANSIFDIILSVIGVFIFSGLTAVSVQQIKTLASKMLMDNQEKNKVALFGALSLYLNLVNLFLSLLRLMGNRK